MTFMSFSHGDTGTIPKSILGLLFFIFIEATGTEGCSQGHFMFGQSFDNDRGDGFIRAVFSAGVFEVGVGEGCHGFGGLFEGYCSFFLSHIVIF